MWIRHRLFCGGASVQAFRFESSFIPGRKPPFTRAAVRVKTIKAAVVTQKENQSICNGRRRRDWTSGLRLPFLLPGLLVDRIQIAISTADVNNSIRNRRRTYDWPCGFELPFDAFQRFRS